MIILIWCQDIVGGISKNNNLPWKNKEEMLHFKNTTINNICVMGRKTYESINKLLPDRTNIILTKNKNYFIEGAEIIHNFKEILNLNSQKKIFIIGGKEIYELFFKYADQLIISIIQKNYNCDLFINFNLENFSLIKENKNLDFITKYYQLKK